MYCESARLCLLYANRCFLCQGKSKYNAWKKEVDAGTKPEAAQKKYVEFVEKLKNEHGYTA